MPNILFHSWFYFVEKEFRCPKCGSENVILVLRVPWSTDGLVPEQHIFLECRDCGHAIPISEGTKK